MRGLMWFREDLRACDNTALYHAQQLSGDGVIAIYILDRSIWRQHDMAACRIDFILRGLAALKLRLTDLNIPLIIETVKSTNEIPDKIYDLIQRYQVRQIFYNVQYEIDEINRDAAVQKIMFQNGIACAYFEDQSILPPGAVKTKNGSYFKKFTPYKRVWQQVFLKKIPLCFLS